jgi:hypothetical protein
MTDTEPIPTSPCDDAGKIMEWIDKLDGFKRYTLVLPIELTFLIVVSLMAYQGHVTEALAAVSAVLGSMVGYYFGAASKP